MELAFNQTASAPLYERLPEFYCREPLPPTDAVWDVPAQELERIWADLVKVTPWAVTRR